MFTHVQDATSIAAAQVLGATAVAYPELLTYYIVVLVKPLKPVGALWF